MRTQLEGGSGVIQNVYSRVQKEGIVMPHVHIRTYTISFHVFGSIFVL